MRSCADGALVLVGFCDSASFRSDTPWSYSLASILARAIRICSIKGSMSVVVGTTPATAPGTADAAVAAVVGAFAATAVDAATGAVSAVVAAAGSGGGVPVSGAAGGRAAANSVVSTPGSASAELARPWMKNTTDATRKMPLIARIHVGCRRLGAAGMTAVELDLSCAALPVDDERASAAGRTPEFEILLPPVADGQLAPLWTGMVTAADDHDATLPDSCSRRTTSRSARRSAAD